MSTAVTFEPLVIRSPCALCFSRLCRALRTQSILRRHMARMCSARPGYGAELASVGAGGGARLAMALRALIRVAALHRSVLRVRIGHAARGEGELPALAAVGAEEGRQRRALLPGEAHDLAAAAAEARALLQHFCFGF